MKYIEKNSSPQAFEDWKVFRKPTHWSQLDGTRMSASNRNASSIYYSKEELREVLLNEQGYTCCYCENEISNNPLIAKVDHIEPKIGNQNQHLIFDYYNLGLSCNGGERDEQPRKIHCDAAKQDNLLSITPYEQRCEEEIRFTVNGLIYSDTSDGTSTIETLNLGIDKLNNLRQVAIRSVVFDSTKNDYVTITEASKLYDVYKARKKVKFKSAILQSLALLKGSTN